MVFRTCLVFPVVLRGRPETSACSSAGEPTTSKPWRPRMCVVKTVYRQGVTRHRARHNREMRHLIAIAALAALGAASASASVQAAAPCTGSELTGSFQAVPNSAGAGNIVYTLRLRNASRATCFVTGVPGVQLLGKHGK